ncbi:ABC transporter ATP-binding protein [Candidatus Paracaedibacter symbiosus]|uniref:ABC transporter ATP-binding protein n=1 Tax=Candidatus Paracaedibacter symbiosus TaxID=244582 RepID=UPI00094E76A8|nr:ATP-binding cassette domain-containing protein [Candidatus Paracaedibacter symbiosus]
MLCLKDISVTMGHGTILERQILTDLNLTIRRGEFVILIGGNGAGKSTLFNAISGALAVDSGSITLDNTDITKWSVEERSPAIAKVLQDPRIATISNMTIEENLSFAYKRGQSRRFARHKNNARREIFIEKLAMLGMGLEKRLNELTGNLSGGQRQALSLIMALMSESKVLLLDEITAALDPTMAKVMMELTTRIVAEEQRTTLMITHNTAHMTHYSDRTLRLVDGQVVAI